MPELPDITVYIEALERRVLGSKLEAARIGHPFLLRTFEPRLDALYGRRVVGLRRIGKRVAIGFEGDAWLVFHLMIAGRLHWTAADVGARTGAGAGSGTLAGSKTPPKRARRGAALATFIFASGTLTLTEAGTKRRASISVFADTRQLEQHDPGGLEVLAAPFEEFSQRLCAGNHTLKRSLTDPRTFSGIGNAYSDEILHRARLSPVALTQKLDQPSQRRLYESARTVLLEWTERLRGQAGDAFPEGVTAFRPEMAVHGRFGKACPVCGTVVQRIRYAENETNYCPRCQTGDRLLADRSLSRLLKDDWPRTIEELENRS